MSWSLLSHVMTQSTNGTSVTSSAIDTTGADLIVVFNMSGGAHGLDTLSDSAGNTWTGLTTYTGNSAVRLFYCEAPVTSASHTFTLTFPGGPFGTGPTVAVQAWSGSGVSPFDVENGVTSGGPTSGGPGSITPNVSGELIVTVYSTGGSPVSITIDSGFTILDQVTNNGNSAAGAHAYLVQMTAGAVSPTFSWGNVDFGGAFAIASFKPGGGGGAASHLLGLMGVGG
jgi:hypothetical protein